MGLKSSKLKLHDFLEVSYLRTKASPSFSSPSLHIHRLIKGSSRVSLLKLPPKTQGLELFTELKFSFS